jgi:osmotically-inducible protein OsmY
MKSDSALRDEVEAELKWDPDIDPDHIAVSIKEGVVTLTGYVRSFNQKWEAEDAAKRVAGVMGVANDLEVRLPFISKRPDPDIAHDIVAAIEHVAPEVADKIKVTVKEGRVTLEGKVHWQIQKKRIDKAARRVRGVADVTSSITIVPDVAAQNLKQQIEQAFKRNAEIDAQRITVETNGDEVTLKGVVRSWAERRAAEETAWRAGGVTKVLNLISIAP